MTISGRYISFAGMIKVILATALMMIAVAGSIPGAADGFVHSYDGHEHSSSDSQQAHVNPHQPQDKGSGHHHPGQSHCGMVSGHCISGFVPPLYSASHIDLHPNARIPPQVDQRSRSRFIDVETPPPRS